MLILKLPFPPSTNHSHTYGGGRKFLDKRTRAFREKVQETVIEQNITKLEGRLSMFIALFPPDKRRRDIGNYEKQTTDALMNAGVFDDDEQIDLITIVREEIVKGGQCVVVLQEIEDGENEGFYDELVNGA